MRERWLTRRAMAATLAVVVWSPGCILAGWWQATVAMSGNTLSYLYAFEWPAFAIFGVVAWWWFVHADPEQVGARGLARLRDAAEAEGQPADAADEGNGAGPTLLLRQQRASEAGDGSEPSPEDEELRAYNEYLASLRDRPKTWARR